MFASLKNFISIVKIITLLAVPITAIPLDTLAADYPVVQMIKRNAANFAIDGNNNGANGQDVYVWAENQNNVNQLWYEIDRGNGYYSYQKFDTDYCLDGNKSGENAQNVYLWSCGGNNYNQHWLKVDMGEDHYRLEKRNATGFSLDGSNGGENGQSIYLWSSNDNNQNQHWTFNYISSGSSNISFDYEIQSIEASATWVVDNSSGDLTYDNGGTRYTHRAILYSTEAYQFDDGFRLTVEFTTGSIGDTAGHNFSFGLISDDTDLSNYTGLNPFKDEVSVYSLGVNITTDGDATARGLNFTNGSKRITLDESGTRAQFVAGETTKVTMEIGIGGSYNYRINDEYEASGVLLNGFEPSKSYHVVVYGQDDHGGGKTIQSIKLEKAPAAGERAAGIRGTWYSGIHPTLIDDRLKSLKTLGGFGVGLTDGATLSAQHYAPNKLIESLPGGDAVVPTWGDLSLAEPETDAVMDNILAIKAAGFKVKLYTNAENFVGSNQDQFLEFIDSWFNYCDTDPEIQAFINSQSYHTGIWNRTSQQYEEATDAYPYRKYMFVYAEYILKEHALRYGKYAGSWIFDDGATMEQMGDNATSGLIEEQRIYQAFADAVHAGNPDIPVAFNNGRSTTNFDSYPFAHATRFDDFTFGHAFGGNNNHAEKVNGSQFVNNYQHVTRMTETNGYVHDGGNWAWDDLIVGNFHSKVSTTAWKYGPNQAWQQDDFNQWSLEALQAGGTMTWDGSYNRPITAVYDWVYVLFEGLDAYLMEYKSPGAPNWARAETILPTATVGQPYSHSLVAGVDFWDPEGDDISEVAVLSGANVPAWLTIKETATGVWTLSGTPTESISSAYTFTLRASDASAATNRDVELSVTNN